ncbi:hypothetical protein DPM35_18730 [Mesorhizobium atlanticum]|uniref:Uncharacterized protein n=1 Tax=Mesorhizobium atlanticum TaxID=2233532 RepID=A0A330GTR4_9HYPH|nr:hypothetical protein DPM35_18730 [Mesorhizobium atlanticum]
MSLRMGASRWFAGLHLAKQARLVVGQAMRSIVTRRAQSLEISLSLPQVVIPGRSKKRSAANRAEFWTLALYGSGHGMILGSALRCASLRQWMTKPR